VQVRLAEFCLCRRCASDPAAPSWYRW
jgi:hypothetical protein